ncbi:MAG: Maf family protein, partial [Myxococcota bacterium]|nr:Maf family protein [Myxococcota bacterium]
MSDAPGRDLILASTSPWRREVLERLGMPFEVTDPAVDEDALRHLPPEEMVRDLAIAKAEATTGLDGLVIGSDQAVDLGGEVLGKPGTPERAVEQLLKMQG